MPQCGSQNSGHQKLIASLPRRAAFPINASLAFDDKLGALTDRYPVCRTGMARIGCLVESALGPVVSYGLELDEVRNHRMPGALRSQYGQYWQAKRRRRRWFLASSLRGACNLTDGCVAFPSKPIRLASSSACPSAKLPSVQPEPITDDRL